MWWDCRDFLKRFKGGGGNIIKCHLAGKGSRGRGRKEKGKRRSWEGENFDHFECGEIRRCPKRSS